MNSDQDFSIKNFFKPLSDIKVMHIIVILGFIVFANCFFNGFVWDDKAFIINNPELHTFNPFALFGPNQFNFASYYRPIPAIYFAALYALSGNTPFLYHLIQVMLHIVNTVLLFYLFKSFFKSPLALVLSLIFLVHPMQVESVSFIAASISVLFFLFGMSALLISKKTDLTNRSLVLIFLLLLCCLLTKETGILFIILICLYRFLFHKPVKKLFFVLMGSIPLYFVLRFGIGHVYFAKENLAPISRIDFLERLQTMPEVFFYYISTFFFPVRLLVEQHWIVKQITFTNFYFPLIIDLVFISVVFYFAYRLFQNNKKLFRIYSFFAVWFVLGIGMHMQVFPLDMTVADRWFYFPMVGMLGMIGVVGSDIKNKSVKNILVVIAIMYISCLSIRSVVRNMDWKDPITLYTHDSEFEENFSIENNLGAELGTVGRYDEALVRLQKSITLFPYETNYANLAVTYERTGKNKEAIDAYQHAFRSDAYNIGNHTHAINTYVGFTELLMKQKAYGEAIKISKEGIRDYPNDSRLWMYLSFASYSLNQKAESIQAAKKAYELSPNQMTMEMYKRISSGAPLKINFVEE